MRSISRRRGLRAVQSLIAVTMLAVPASALALTRDAGGDHAVRSLASLPATFAPRHLHLGQPVRVSGRTSAREAGRRVLLQTAPRAQASWRTIAATRVGRAGGYALRPRLRRSALLRTVEVGPRATIDAPRDGQATGGTGLTAEIATAHVAAISKATTVEVAASLHVMPGERAAISARPTVVAGHLLPGRGGRRIALQGHSGHGWRTLARARTGGRGGFALRWRHPAGNAGRGLRVVFAGDRLNARTTDGAGTVTVYRPALASWYEDGAATGCGFHAGLGVANKSLPCGAKVRVRYGGRSVTATVDDRGPYVGDREFDLNQNTAGALHFGGVGTVYVSTP